MDSGEHTIESSDSENDSECDDIRLGHDSDDDQGVAFARPVSYAALKGLPANHLTLLGLGGLVRPNSTSSSSDDSSTRSSCDGHIKKLLRLLREVTTTEVGYVRDLQILSVYLKDCTYSVLDQVRGFVTSMPFASFRVSTDSVFTINSLFSQHLQKCLAPLPPAGNDDSDFE